MPNVHRIALTLVSIFLILAFSPSIYGQGLTSVQQSQLTQIAAMFHRGSSKQEIVNAWERFVRANPQIDVRSALAFLKTNVEKTGSEQVQRARTRLASIRTSQESLKNQLATARQDRQAQKKVQELQAKLDKVGEDAQSANAEVQRSLQEQQQSAQLLSSIQKELYDAAQAILRNLRSEGHTFRPQQYCV